MSVNLQAAAEALTDSAPGLPSPFERFSKSVTQLVGGPSFDDGPQAETLAEEEEEELDMSIRTDSIDTAFFADPGGNGVKLRGATYLEDKKKVRLASSRVTLWSCTQAIVFVKISTRISASCSRIGCFRN